MNEIKKKRKYRGKGKKMLEWLKELKEMKK